MTDTGGIETYVSVRPVAWMGRISGYQASQAVSGVSHHTIVIHGYIGRGSEMKLQIRDPATPIGMAYSEQWSKMNFAELHRTLPCIAFFYLNPY